ncbi:MAG: hypothetical protein ABI992_08010 [Chthoniobacterales bacterium]
MNLPYTFELLSATNQQRYGFIKLRGRMADREVRQMAEAGLVQATFNDGKPGSFTSINRILDRGYAFLQTFSGRGTAVADRRLPS